MMDRKGTDREAGLTTDELASAGRRSAPDAAARDAGTVRPHEKAVPTDEGSSSAPGIGATSPPASEVAGRTTGETTGAATPDTTTEPLLAADETTRFQDRWERIQSMFVDEPQQAVENADQLVAELMQHLVRLFAQERESLERQWSGGGVASTEDLRVALHRYRSFFQRLLST
jgi:hypothetical protein